jgi:hypothetical protein
VQLALNHVHGASNFSRGQGGFHVRRLRLGLESRGREPAGVAAQIVLCFDDLNDNAARLSRRRTKVSTADV